MLCYFEIFTSPQGSMRTISKHYSECKMVWIKFRKALQERRLPILKFSQDNPQKYFQNFTVFRGYSWNFFETDIRGMLLEYSGNITLRLLEFAKRSTFVIIKSYLFNTKATFSSRLSKNLFPLKCSLNVLNIARLREHSPNISGILLVSCNAYESCNKRKSSLSQPSRKVVTSLLEYELISLFQVLFVE